MTLTSGTLNRVLRPVIAAIAVFLLSACEPKEITIKACTVSGRLAVEVEDTKGWFLTTKARPWSINFYEPLNGPAWDTQVPHNFIEDKPHTYQPMRSILIYGVPLDGWEVRQMPLPLKFGVDYNVEVWSDGGRGMLTLKGGRLYPACDQTRDLDKS